MAQQITNNPYAGSYISNPFKVFVNGFKALGNNLPTLLLLYLSMVGVIVAGALLVVVGGLIAAAADQAVVSVLMFLLGVALLISLLVAMVILQAALYKYALATVRGQPLDFKPAFAAGQKKAAGLLGLSLLMVLIIVGGLILLIIPGIIFAYWYWMAPYIYLDNDVSIGEALKRSKQLTKGKFVEWAGLGATTMIFQIPTAIPFLGNLVSLVLGPVALLAFGYRYSSAAELQRSGQTKPPTDKANYIAIFIGPALFIVFMIIITLATIESSQSI